MGLTVEERLKALIEKKTIRCPTQPYYNDDIYKIENGVIMSYKYDSNVCGQIFQSDVLLNPNVRFEIVDEEYPLTCKEAMTLAFNEGKKVISEITPGLIQYFDENNVFCYKYGNGKISYSELTKEEINAHWKVVE